MKRANKWILSTYDLMNLSWGTVNFKLYNNFVLLIFIIRRKRRSHVVINYVVGSNKYPTEECVGFSSTFKKVYV